MSCKCHFCVHWDTKNSHDACFIEVLIVVVWNQTPNIFGYTVFDLTYMYFTFYVPIAIFLNNCTSAVMLWVQDLINK